jgi:SAM-dependent methyltransferase
MSTSSLVRDRVLAEQRNTWSSAGEAWLEWCETFERGGGPVNDRLIELAGIEAGDHVLDIGSGVGQPAMTAAERVGDAGEVLGIDVSPTMVELAAGRGGGLSRVKYAVGDLLDLDLPPASFQAVLSRWALMFIPEREAVLRRIRELLVPSGIFVAAVWGPPQTAPIVGLPFQTLGPVLLAGAPATPEAANGPEQTGPYAMADLGRCRDELTSAGFAEVTA